MMLPNPSTAISIQVTTSCFRASSGRFCRPCSRALSSNRTRFRNIDSISPSCSQISRGISITVERPGEFISQSLDSVPSGALGPGARAGMVRRRWLQDSLSPRCDVGVSWSMFDEKSGVQSKEFRLLAEALDAIGIFILTKTPIPAAYSGLAVLRYENAKSGFARLRALFRRHGACVRQMDRSAHVGIHRWS